MAWRTAVHEDGPMSRPLRHAPSPRRASKRSPLTRLTTSAASGPSASTAHSEVANQGIPCAALVEPSRGSTTTSNGRSALLQAALLRQHADPRSPEDGQRRGVRGQVGVVLTGRRPGQAPVPHPRQRGADGLDHLVQQGHRLSGRHRSARPRHDPSR